MILITAFPDDGTRTKARQLGAVALLEKPFDVDALLAVARRILPLGLEMEKWPCQTPCRRLILTCHFLQVKDGQKDVSSVKPVKRKSSMNGSDFLK